MQEESCEEINYEYHVEEKQFIHLFISGGVAVGKSSTMNLLERKFKGIKNLFFIREYIDYDSKGEQMLADSFNKKIDLFDFQVYIMNCFVEQINKCMKEVDWKSKVIFVWERHPLEAIKIFAQYMGKDKEKVILDMFKNKIKKSCCCPDLKGENFGYVTKLDTRIFTIEIVADYIYNAVIDSIFSNNSYNIWFMLHCDVEGFTQKMRLISRNRECEVKHYTDTHQLYGVNKDYFNLYKELLYYSEHRLIDEFSTRDEML